MAELGLRGEGMRGPLGRRPDRGEHDGEDDQDLAPQDFRGVHEKTLQANETAITTQAPCRGRATSRSARPVPWRSEEHTSELQSLIRISYAVFCLKKKRNTQT